jgi:hypothetical protein
MLKEIINILSKNWEKEGHHLTGGFEKSLKGVREGNKIIIEGNDYGIYMNYGIKASRIPYKQGSGAKSSKYIQGLMNYGKLRKGLSGKQLKAFAFAVARKQKKRGSPLRTNGKGTRFIDKSMPDIEQVIYKGLEKEWGGKVDKIFKI